VPSDVPDHVIDVEEADGPHNGIVLDMPETRQKGTGVVRAFHESMDSVAVCCDAGDDDATMLVGYLRRLLNTPSATAGRLSPGLTGIVHPKGDDMNSVTVSVNMTRDVAIRPQSSRKDKADLSLLQYVRGTITLTGLGACVRHKSHTEGGPIKVGRLASIADVELNVVGTLEWQEISGGT